MAHGEITCLLLGCVNMNNTALKLVASNWANGGKAIRNIADFSLLGALLHKNLVYLVHFKTFLIISILDDLLLK